MKTGRTRGEKKVAERVTLTIRLATSADRPEWGRLRQALWPDCHGPRARLEMREQLSDPQKFGVLVIDRGNGALAGFAELALRDGIDGAAREVTAFLEGWYVAPDLRGRGWGRKLIRAAERWARERGMVELASDAEPDNTDGLAAHLAVGFRESGRVVQFLKRVRK